MDTSMNELIDGMQNIMEGTIISGIAKEKINEEMTDADYKRIMKKLESPEMRPIPGDITFEAWLMRIDLWGKLTFKHKDPERRKSGKVTKNEFLKRITDQHMNRMFGEWEISQPAFNEVLFQRTYYGDDSKRYTEEFLIKCKLKKELSPPWWDIF